MAKTPVYVVFKGVEHDEADYPQVRAADVAALAAWAKDNVVSDSTTIASPNTEGERVTKFIVIAIAGQSNSVGYDESEWSEETHGNKTPNRIKQLGYYGDDNLKVIPLGVVAQNLQNMEALQTGVTLKGTKGLHLPLAQQLLPHIPADYGILIVPVAYGNTGFTSGTEHPYNTTALKPNLDNPGGGHWNTEGAAYYQTLRDRVKYALDLNPENKFAGVIWCQGEADFSKKEQQPERFQAFVNRCNTAWQSYANRTAKGVIDKSLWYVHETTSYWRSSNANCKDVSNIWSAYQEFLTPSNYVFLAPDDTYTNATNGVGAGSNKPNRTSSQLNSHIGNDAYRTFIAPRMADKLLRNGHIYGASSSARALTNIEKHIDKTYSTMKGAYLFSDDGTFTLKRVQPYGNPVKNDVRSSSFTLDKNITSISFDELRSGVMLILQTDDNGKYIAMFFSGAANTNANIVIGNTTGNLLAGSWDSFDTPSGCTGLDVTTTTFTGTTTIETNKQGVYTVKRNGSQVFQFDLSAQTYDLNKTGGSNPVYQLGVMYFWSNVHADMTEVGKMKDIVLG